MDVAAVTLDIMDAVRSCLCEALGDGDDQPCFCGLYSGPLTVADWCSCSTDRRGVKGCGMAWVRLDRGPWPTTSFPQVAQGPNNCGSQLAIQLELGVYRCLPVSAADGEPPTAVQQAEATIQQLADMAAMHRVITCCEAIQDRPHVMGTYLPRGDGDCGGGIWTVQVGLVKR